MIKNKHNYIKKSIDHIDLQHLLIGTTAGGIIGLTVGLLVAAAQPKKRTNGFYSRCCDIGNKIEEIGEDVMHKGHEAFDKASEVVENIKDQACQYWDGSNHSKLLLLGAISAGLVGISSILLYKTQAEKEAGLTKFVKQSARKSMRKAHSIDWMELITQVLNALNERNEEEEEETAKTEPIQDALGLALQGIKVWKNLNRR